MEVKKFLYYCLGCFVIGTIVSFWAVAQNENGAARQPQREPRLARINGFYHAEKQVFMVAYYPSSARAPEIAKAFGYLPNDPPDSYYLIGKFSEGAVVAARTGGVLQAPLQTGISFTFSDSYLPDGAGFQIAIIEQNNRVIITGDNRLIRTLLEEKHPSGAGFKKTTQESELAQRLEEFILAPTTATVNNKSVRGVKSLFMDLQTRDVFLLESSIFDPVPSLDQHKLFVSVHDSNSTPRVFEVDSFIDMVDYGMRSSYGVRVGEKYILVVSKLRNRLITLTKNFVRKFLNGLNPFLDSADSSFEILGSQNRVEPLTPDPRFSEGDFVHEGPIIINTEAGAVTKLVPLAVDPATVAMFFPAQSKNYFNSRDSRHALNLFKQLFAEARVLKGGYGLSKCVNLFLP